MVPETGGVLGGVELVAPVLLGVDELLLVEVLFFDVLPVFGVLPVGFELGVAALGEVLAPLLELIGTVPVEVIWSAVLLWLSAFLVAWLTFQPVNPSVRPIPRTATIAK